MAVRWAGIDDEQGEYDMTSEHLKVLTSAVGAMAFTFASLLAVAVPIASIAPDRIADSHVRG